MTPDSVLEERLDKLCRMTMRDDGPALWALEYAREVKALRGGARLTARGWKDAETENESLRAALKVARDDLQDARALYTETEVKLAAANTVIEVAREGLEAIAEPHGVLCKCCGARLTECAVDEDPDVCDGKRARDTLDTLAKMGRFPT